MANVDTVVPTKANVTIAPKFLKNCFCTKKNKKTQFSFYSTFTYAHIKLSHKQQQIITGKQPDKLL